MYHEGNAVGSEGAKMPQKLALQLIAVRSASFVIKACLALLSWWLYNQLIVIDISRESCTANS